MPGCRAIAGVAGGGGGPLLLELVLVVSGCAAFGGKPKFFATAAFARGIAGGLKLGKGKAGRDVCCCCGAGSGAGIKGVGTVGGPWITTSGVTVGGDGGPG